MAPTSSNARVFCLVALLVMSTTFLSCDAAGGWTKFCVPEKACQTPAGLQGDYVCKVDCGRQGYDEDKSHCASGICCCEK
ncbi:unnamed protein product [Triticum turgidum subsp. durum]|uniref:Uncharacterized protein n=1 Tax=Triticum turgidum subsp. durum TaxID=4567 RepID=A0A9R0XVT4_TRITD|nr:unnamed protein product [Triticum turgidum subsp. durum]